MELMIYSFEPTWKGTTGTSPVCKIMSQSKTRKFVTEADTKCVFDTRL